MAALMCEDQFVVFYLCPYLICHLSRSHIASEGFSCHGCTVSGTCSTLSRVLSNMARREKPANSEAEKEQKVLLTDMKTHLNYLK